MHRLSNENVSHIIFTRFNVRSGGKEKSIRDKTGWLKERYELFDIYCFPSVAAQSQTDFIWIVFFDDQTPEEYVKQNEIYHLKFPNFHPVYVSEWTTEIVRGKLQEVIPDGAEWLLTTRLDNDDGLHKDFIKTLRASSFTDKTYFNFPDGLTYSDGNGYKHRDESNAFLSYVEPVENFEGVWKHAHPEVIKKFHVEQLSLPYAWLQVIHGGNVSNKVRGTVEDPTKWSSGYGSLNRLKLNDFGGIGQLVDQWIMSPLRNFRDFMIRSLKKLAGK